MPKPPTGKSATVGYSGKSLVDKLGYQTGMNAIAIGSPDHYADLLDGAAIPRKASVPRSGAFDFIHLFVKDRAALEVAGAKLERVLAPGGMVWISWPKKTSPLFNDLTEEGIREVMLPAGNLVDVKVCAVDADWSGLKFLRRKA